MFIWVRRRNSPPYFFLSIQESCMLSADFSSQKNPRAYSGKATKEKHRVRETKPATMHSHFLFPEKEAVPMSQYPAVRQYREKTILFPLIWLRRSHRLQILSIVRMLQAINVFETNESWTFRLNVRHRCKWIHAMKVSMLSPFGQSRSKR